ncbi:hypothetical protein Pint_36549 [Pistacia integerrima]|uniref:Uncharacterized protein n=1 Tax=Pistacia integerrima TaxID=434235 RepID=A0ACC0Y1I7_9ROSI|nr:hypothetical protein Pint_36549 [Pistacia integerrima]
MGENPIPRKPKVNPRRTDFILVSY